MTLGASNVSFGMPDRHAIGAAFLPVAISHGLTSAIMDARSPQIVRAVKAADLLLDRDPWGASWIAAHRAAQAAAAQATAAQAGAAQAAAADAAAPGTSAAAAAAAQPSP
jgi:5-methyltetrahydrofolate--homocysteine methyltransferase